MAQLIGAAALGLSVLAVLVGVAALVRTRSLVVALPLTLDLLTAAGLLRLSAQHSWASILGAAAIIAVRKLAVLGIHASTARAAGG